METTLNIEGKNIKLKASGGLLRLYRFAFGKDVITEFNKYVKSLPNVPQEVDLEIASQDEKEEYNKAVERYNEIAFEKIDFTLLENIAWAMAKKADSNIPDVDVWLDGFENPSSLYTHFQEIINLFSRSLETHIQAKNAKAAVGQN